jgi:O-acetyl-ADP-ribose deacetylase (regulator of RNase III)
MRKSGNLIYHRTSVLESSAQTLVNTVNCVGVMGKGIAKDFKDREPGMFAAYKRICNEGALEPGKLWLWQGQRNWVLNFPTKIHWRNPSRLEWIEAGLQKFVAEYARRGIREIAFPRLGCGNGGLNWDDVRPLMERYLSGLDIPVYIHDFDVPIVMPEHLSEVAAWVKDYAAGAPSFPLMVSAIQHVAEKFGENLVSIDTNAPFKLSVHNRAYLTIEQHDIAEVIEVEDLRSMWVSLLNGPLTRTAASKLVNGSAGPLLSVLSILPQLRPIQVELMETGTPEPAVEFRPSDRQAAVAAE